MNDPFKNCHNCYNQVQPYAGRSTSAQSKAVRPRSRLIESLMKSLSKSSSRSDHSQLYGTSCTIQPGRTKGICGKQAACCATCHYRYNLLTHTDTVQPTVWVYFPTEDSFRSLPAWQQCNMQCCKVQPTAATGIASGGLNPHQSHMASFMAGFKQRFMAGETKVLRTFVSPGVSDTPGELSTPEIPLSM